MKKSGRRDIVGKKIKVFVGLSGGVDSSVAAALLVRRGYDVTGVFMKNWSEPHLDSHKGPCWIDERRDAMRVAAKLKIPFLMMDFEKEYKSQVVDYMFHEYEAGRTPNPDIICNKLIKFPLFWREAKKLGADFIATGHYARIKSINSQSAIRNPQYKLLKGVDEKKDQSYFLYAINQEDLSHTLFPVGNLTKTEVRKIAAKLDLPTAKKEESMGICFVGEVKIKDFLQKKIKSIPGKIVDTDGKVIGKHDGIWYYTIGQRSGLGIGGGEPYFVVGKDVKKNVLIVARGASHPALYNKEAELRDVHWISGVEPKLPIKAMVRLRHQHPGGRATVKKIGDKIKIIFDKHERAITPGQSAVFYKGEECLGGGVVA
jgi:tRNA-specific 2-thiouridylase